TGEALMNQIVRKIISRFNEPEVHASVIRNEKTFHTGNITYSLALLHHEKGKDAVIFRRFEATVESNFTFEERFANTAILKEGFLVEWNMLGDLKDPHLFIGTHHQPKDVTKLLDVLADENGFQPPFLIGEL